MNEPTEITTDNCVLTIGEISFVAVVFTDFCDDFLDETVRKKYRQSLNKTFQKINKLNDWYEGTHLEKIENEFCEPGFEEVTESE